MANTVNVERDVAMSERLIISLADAIDKAGGGVSEKSAPQIIECLLITVAQTYIQWGMKPPEMEQASLNMGKRLLEIYNALIQDRRNQNWKPVKGLLIKPW